MTTERVEHMAGGQGHTLVKRLLDEKQLTENANYMRR